MPNVNARILRMGHTGRQVHTKAQVREGLSSLLIRCLIHDKVACSHTAVAPTGKTSHVPSVSALIHVSYLTCVKVEEGQCPSIDNRYTPSSPQALIHRVSLASISLKQPTAGPCSAATTTHVPVAPGALESLEASAHRSSKSTVTSAIQQSSFEFASPRDIPPPIVQERPENVSSPTDGIPPHLLVSPSSNSPPKSTAHPTPNAIDDVAPTVSPERQKGTTQRSSNSLPRSEEKKVSPIHSQTKIKRSTRAGVTQKPSTKFAPFSLTPNQPGPLETRREAPSRLMMPGAFPGTSLDDVDVSSWVLVSPVGPDCQVEVSKRNWFKRIISRFG